MVQATSESAAAPIGHPDSERVAPKRIQLSREKGWRLPDNAVKVDRSTQWGNPYRVGERMSMPMARRWGWEISPRGQKIVCEDAKEAVRRFAHCVQWDEAIHGYIRDQLGGRDLACWCALDAPCHADVLLTIANAEPRAISRLNAAIDEAIIEQSRAST